MLNFSLEELFSNITITDITALVALPVVSL